MQSPLPSNNDYSLSEKIINGKYLIKNEVGSGAFTKVYSAFDIEKKVDLAIKSENDLTKYNIVFHEAEILERFAEKKLGSKEGLPKIYWCGQEDQRNYLAMELLGPNLETLWNLNGRKFTLQRTVALGIQMLKRLESVHEYGYIHGDIKPANFAIGIKEKSEVLYLIDYNLCKSYINPKTGGHIPYKENQTLKGNYMFASVNAHLGIAQSRRDDLESLVYVLIYLNRGGFPWTKEDNLSKAEKSFNSMDGKMSTPAEIICRGLPDEFLEFFYYCKGLSFKEKPDYRYLKSLLYRILEEKGLSTALCFESSE